MKSNLKLLPSARRHPSGLLLSLLELNSIDALAVAYYVDEEVYLGYSEMNPRDLLVLAEAMRREAYQQLFGEEDEQ